MAELLNEKIELGITTEELAAFAAELEVALIEGQTDLELASEIIGAIDGLEDGPWDAMTMALKEWSNTINNSKIAVAEEEKKAAISAKTQKTKTDNAAAAGFPTTPAAIKKAINDCKNKADIAAAVVGIAKALGMDAAPSIAKSWTVAKQKEAAIAGLQKPKAAKTPNPSKPSKPAATTPAATPGPARTKSPTTTQVKTAKAGAATKAADAAKKGGAIVEGEPFRRNTTAWMIWDVFNKSKAKGGVVMDTVVEKFNAALKASDQSSTNPGGRVKRVIAELKKMGLLEKKDTGNFGLIREE